MKKIIISILLILVGISYSQNKDPKINPQKEKKIESVSQFEEPQILLTDKFSQNSLIDSLNEHYKSILEKTNNQLSLWTNPYGIMVGALAILFTIMAIVATIILYIQNRGFQYEIEKIRKEFRFQIDTIIKNYKDELNKFNEEKEGLMKEKNSALDDLIAKYSESLNELKVKESTISESHKDKGFLEKLEKFEKEKEKVEELLNRIESNSAEKTKNIKEIVKIEEAHAHKCSKCGFGFFIENSGYTSILGNLVNYQNPLFILDREKPKQKTVTCPKCGNVDIIY